MNKIQAKIINIKKESNAALVKLQDKHDNIFSVLMLDFDNNDINCN